MLLRSPGWVMTTIFLILQMALLWTLAKAKASPSLPSTLLLVLLGLGLAPLMLLRYESWLMPVIALTLVLFEQESWGFKSTAILVNLFMSLVFIATLYINWLYGDAYYFLNSSYSSLHYQRQRLSYNRRFLGQLAWSFTWIVQVVPVYLLIVGWILWQDKRWG